MRILHLLPSVNPAEGGPLEYACTVAGEHAKAGHESVFVTLDNPKASWVKTVDFEVHATGPTSGLLKSSSRFGETLARLGMGSDAAVVHGLWSHASIGGYPTLRAAKLPWVIFPHGMLDPYFRGVKPVKHVIKQVYWNLWQGRMLSEAAAVLFTCAEEQRLAHGAFLGHQQYQAKVTAFCAADQNLAKMKMAEGWREVLGRIPQLAARPYWLFLSRIHPKKAIDNLITAYAGLADRPDCPDLVIAGPDSVNWQPTLQRLAQELGISQRVHFPGMLLGAVKSAAFAKAEAFVLPSHQENFGIVVAESLSVSTPVLISDKVNIWRAVVEAGAGLAEPDTVVGTQRLLERYLDLSAEARAAMKDAARSCYDRQFSAKAAADDLLGVLTQARRTDRSAPRADTTLQ